MRLSVIETDRLKQNQFNDLLYMYSGFATVMFFFRALHIITLTDNFYYVHQSGCEALSFPLSAMNSPEMSADHAER